MVTRTEAYFSGTYPASGGYPLWSAVRAAPCDEGAVIYCVSYELRRSRNCPAFFRALSTLGARQLVGPLWLGESPLEAVDLLRIFQSSLERDDAISVLRLREPVDSACWNASASGEALLSEADRALPATVEHQLDSVGEQDRISRPAAWPRAG